MLLSNSIKNMVRPKHCEHPSSQHLFSLSTYFKAGSEMRADSLCYWRSCVSVGEGLGLDWGCASRRCCHSRCPGSVWRGRRVVVAGEGAKVRGQPHTDTTHQARCEEMLTGRGQPHPGWQKFTLFLANSGSQLVERDPKVGHRAVLTRMQLRGCPSPPRVWRGTNESNLHIHMYECL